jgi:two-component system OmpR family response regulator
VLLIEDNPYIRDANRRALTKSGYRVMEAETISTGRALYESEHPDLIILETELPDGDGLNFCRELREQARCILILVLGLIGTDGEDGAITYLRAGCDAYLYLPRDFDLITAQVSSMMRYAPKHREANRHNRPTGRIL